MEILINEVSMENQNFEYTNMLESYEVESALIELKHNEYLCIEDFLLHKHAKAEGKIILEDVTVNPKNNADREAARRNMTKGQAFMNKVKEVIRNFVNFIKSIIYKFTDKVQELLKLNAGWFEKNAYKIAGIEDSFWNDCKIDCYPYNENLIKGTIYSNGSKFQSFKNSSVMKNIDNGFENDDALKAYVCRVVHDLDPESFVNGAKIFYRGDKTVKVFTGSDAKEICGKFVEYVKDYSNISKLVTNGINEAAKQVADLERKYNPDGTIKEGFIDSENVNLYSILEDTQLQYGELKDLVLEDVNGVEYIVCEATKKETDKSANGSVEMEPAGSNVKKTVTKRGASKVGSNTLTRRMKYWRLVLDMNTARMTIAEEFYNCAMRTLRAVVRNAEGRGEIRFRGSDSSDEPKTEMGKEAKAAYAKASQSKTKTARQEAIKRTNEEYAQMSGTAQPKG